MLSQIHEPDSKAQLAALEENVKEFGLTYFGFGDRRQGESFDIFLFVLSFFLSCSSRS